MARRLRPNDATDAQRRSGVYVLSRHDRVGVDRFGGVARFGGVDRFGGNDVPSQTHHDEQAIHELHVQG